MSICAYCGQTPHREDCMNRLPQANENQAKITDLRRRIILANLLLKWLRSEDPMLIEPKWSPLVPAAIERMTEQLHELNAELSKLIEHEEQPEPITIGLKPAKLTGKALS